MSVKKIQKSVLLNISYLLIFNSVVIAQIERADSVVAADTLRRAVIERTPEDSAGRKASSVTSAIAEEPSTASVKPKMAPSPAIEWKLTAGKMFWAAVVFGIAFLVIRFLSNIFESIAERWGRLRLFIKRLIPTFRILVWTLVIYEVITRILAPPLETIIAVSAAVGLSVGLASQDILKNVFGGIIILLDRPFQVGDKIEAGGYYGEVKQIGLRTVRIVTPDDSLVSIPNADIMNQAVSNANAGEPNCQVVAEIFLPADTDTEKAREIAYMAAATSRYVYLNKPIAVIIKNEIYEGRSRLKLRLKAYVLDLRYEFSFMSEMTEIVIKELLNAGLVTPEELH